MDNSHLSYRIFKRSQVAQGGLIAGGTSDRRGRQTCFFSAMDPLDKSLTEAEIASVCPCVPSVSTCTCTCCPRVLILSTRFTQKTLTQRWCRRGSHQPRASLLLPPRRTDPERQPPWRSRSSMKRVTCGRRKEEQKTISFHKVKNT